MRNPYFTAYYQALRQAIYKNNYLVFLLYRISLELSLGKTEKTQ